MKDIFKALSEESRLRILSLLLEGEMCVCKIEHCLEMTQSNTSRHLTVLKRNGILDSYKKDLWTYYHISDKFINENKELWHYIKPKLKEQITYKNDYENYCKYISKDICSSYKKPH